MPTKKISVLGATLVLISLLLATTCDAQSYLYAAKAFLAQRKHAMSYVPQPPSDTVLTKVGQWGWGPCLGVAVKGNYAFIGNGALLQVLDIRIPTSPQPVGQILTAGTVFKVMVSGNYAYTISPFQIFDISNPLSPRLVSTFKLPTFYTPTTFTVKGNYAYVGDFNGDIYIIDISDPYSPKVVGSMETSGETVAAIAVNGTQLYTMSGGGAELEDFDISNLSSPVLVNSVSSGYGGGSLAVFGDYLYMGTGASPNFSVFNISGPSKLSYAGGINVANYPLDISISGNCAYLSLGTGGFDVVDISDPSRMRVLSALSNPLGPHGESSVGFGPEAGCLTPDYAYLATSTGLWVINISNLGSPRSSYFYSTGGYVNEIAIDSSKDAFVAWQSGLDIVNYSDPSLPVTIGRYSPNENIGNVIISSDKAYVLCRTDLFILDVSNPSQPQELGSLSMGEVTAGQGFITYGTMTISNDTLFIATVSRELLEVDVSNPTHPSVLGSASLSGNPIDISTSDGYLYVTEADMGIEIFRASGSGELSAVGFSAIPNIRGAEIDGERLFVAADSFFVYDISDPLHPVAKGSTELPGGDILTVSLSISGNYVYASYGTSFLLVDVSDAANPQLVYGVTGLLTWYVSADSNLVLLGAGQDGFFILNNNLVSPLSPPSVAPSSYVLFQNYPNPFNPTTTIDFETPTSGRVVINVYDVLGRKVEMLLDEYEQAGPHSVEFDGEGLVSGVYFYQLSVNDQSVTKKMVLLR